MIFSQRNDTDTTPGSHRISSLLFLGALGVVLLAHIYLNRQAGYSFPIPWPDEAHFLWQADAIAHDNSLFSDELNSERTIMWQPPGYMVVTGLLFKITGTSLDAARLLSLVLLLGGMVLLVRFCSHYGHRWPTLALCTLFFLNARFLACGNIARMESLLLLMVLAGYVLIQRGKSLAGLTILLLTPLVHFNGAWFILFGLLLMVFRGELANLRRQVGTGSALPLLLVLLAWVGYLILIMSNWDSFLHDMAFQFDRKAGREVWSVITQSDNLVMLLLLSIGAVYGVKSRLPAVELLFLAFPAWLLWPIGHELWYEVIYHIGYLLISLFVLHAWFSLLPVIGSRRRQVVRAGIGGLVALTLIGWNIDRDRIEKPWDYYGSTELVTMDIDRSVPYLTENDRQEIARILMAQKEESTMTVEFEPVGDGILFSDQAINGLKINCPVFEDRQPDIYVVHMSRHLPDWWYFGDEALKRAELSRDSVGQVIYQRDSTELWYFGIMSEPTGLAD